MAIQSNFPSLKPSLLLDFANTKQLDPRITFTRASTATFYNGVTTAMAEQNLFTYSQEFDNGVWLKALLTVTANTTTAPDGNTTAESTVQNTGQTSSGAIYQTLNLPAQSYTLSVFAKANTKTRLMINVRGGTKTWFDLSAGTVGTTGAGVTASIQSVGNSWYRCSIVFTGTGTSATYGFYPAETDNSEVVTDSGGIYIWGAQLEQRSAVTAYTATTTQAITNYIPKLQSAASGVARFDNNPTTGESLGLLIEESRTNFFQRSDDFADTYWSKNGSTVSSNTLIAPDGTLTADTAVETATTADHWLYRSETSLTTAQAYTFSVYAKYAGRFLLLVLSNSVSGDVYVYFDLQTGTITKAATATKIYQHI